MIEHASKSAGGAIHREPSAWVDSPESLAGAGRTCGLGWCPWPIFAPPGMSSANAEDMGADAVVNFRYETSTIAAAASEVIAYGTAIKYKN